MRSVRYVGVALLWIGLLLGNETASSGYSRDECDAAICVECNECGNATEETCDDLCNLVNNPEELGTNPECEDWIYSQESAFFCDFDNCQNPNKCVIKCHCAPDEPNGSGR